MIVVPVSFRKAKAVVVPGRVELPTSTLSVWRSNQLSYRTVFITSVVETFDGCRIQKGAACLLSVSDTVSFFLFFQMRRIGFTRRQPLPERRCSSRTFRYGYLVTT